MGSNKAFLGIITAAVVGALIGLLIAPEDGYKTRKKIKRKTNSLASDLIEALERSKQKVSDATDTIQEKGSHYADEAAAKVDEYADAAGKEINKF